jgi:SAM-dependent methyltransferase
MTKASDLIKEVPFDQYSRQFQVAAVIKFFESTKPLNILDVGGYKGRTADFLLSENITVLDLYDVKEKNYVKASALEMPFEDNSFDFVTSFDVLEHIPQKDRQKFIEECSRVAKKGVIICAPNKTDLNELAENKLNKLFKLLHGKPHQWLKEHIENGIPDFNWVDRAAKSNGLHTVRFFSNKTQLWFSMQQAVFLNSKFPFGAGDLIKLNKFYNENFTYDGGGSDTSSYRQIICCFTEEKDAKLIKKKLSNLNLPLDANKELELNERINEYYINLVKKTSQLVDDYKDLYEFHNKRADDLQAINAQLTEKLERYEKSLSAKLFSRRVK